MFKLHCSNGLSCSKLQRGGTGAQSPLLTSKGGHRGSSISEKNENKKGKEGKKTLKKDGKNGRILA
jgi:hypothetical protein